MALETTRELNHGVDEVWTVLGERFADISTWSSGVRKSSLRGDLAVGGVRTCELADGNTITEKITEFNPNRKSLTFVVDSGLPPIVHSVENAMTVTSASGGQARVTSTLTPDVKWWAKPMTPIMNRQFSAMISGILDDLAAELDRQATGPAER